MAGARERPRCRHSLSRQELDFSVQPTSSSGRARLGPRSRVCDEAAALLEPSGSVDLVALPESRALGASANCLSVKELTRFSARSTSMARYLVCPEQRPVLFRERGLQRLLAPTVHDTLWSDSDAVCSPPIMCTTLRCPNRCSTASVTNMGLGENSQRFICFPQCYVTVGSRYKDFLGHNLQRCLKLF